MKVSEKLKNNKHLVWALLFALFNMGAIFLIFGFQQYGDSSEYIGVIQWLGGESAEAAPWRLLKPLGPILALPFEFLGEGAGLIVQNAFFYLFSAFLIFKITDLIFNNKKQALLASIFFVTATPLLEAGLSYLTDMGAWFFYLLSIFLTLLYLKNHNEKLVILNGFLSGIGLLMKENGGLGVLFFGLMILLSKNFTIKEKFFKIARFGMFFLIPIVVVQILVFKYYDYTYWDWYLNDGRSLHGEGLFLVFLRYFGQFFRILGILWPLALIGMREIMLEKNWERIKIFLALTPSSFSFLLWTFAGGGRTAFVFAPLGILLASRGLVVLEDKLRKKNKVILLMTILFLLTVLVLNYSFAWINPKISFIDKIAELLRIL